MLRTAEICREWELVVCCARARLDDRNAERILVLLRNGVNWPEAVANAIQHNLISLVYEHMATIGGDLVPQVWREALRQGAQDLEAIGLTLFAEASRISELLREQKIPVIPYQVPVLGWLASRLPTHRVFVDLDFALQHRHIPDAAAILEGLRYRAEFDVHQADARTSQPAHAPFRFHQQPKGMTIELHTERTLRYFPVSADFCEATRHLTQVELGGQKLLTTSIEDALLMLCVRGTKAFWDRLGYISDVSELIQQQPVDWAQAVRIAERLRSVPMLLSGVDLASRVLGAPVPPAILARAQNNSRARWLAGQACEQLFGTEGRSPSIFWRAAFRIRSRDSFREGFLHMLRLTMSPTESDRRTICLSAPPSTFQAIRRPWRLLREYGTGLRQRRKPDLAGFEPTPQQMIEHGLRLACVGPGDVLYDLGCGDGRVATTAAKEFGIRAVGADINPRRISEARTSARRQGVQHLVEFLVQDARKVDISEATVVWLYLGPVGNLRLLERLRSQLRPGARIVSHGFPMFGWLPDEQELHILPDGKSRLLFLWRIRDFEARLP